MQFKKINSNKPFTLYIFLKFNSHKKYVQHIIFGIKNRVNGIIYQATAGLFSFLQ